MGKPRYVWILANDSNIQGLEKHYSLICQAPPPPYISEHACLMGNGAMNLEAACLVRDM